MVRQHGPRAAAGAMLSTSGAAIANVGNYPPVLKATGLYFSQAIIWDKQHPVLTRKDYMGDHEWCFYGWREGAAHQFFGPNNATDLWGIKKVNPQSMIHLTEKPVELAARAMEYSSKPGENVLDLFGGSGSTLIAAEQTGRKAFLMELDALYCDVIVHALRAVHRAKGRTAWPRKALENLSGAVRSCHLSGDERWRREASGTRTTSCCWPSPAGRRWRGRPASRRQQSHGPPQTGESGLPTAVAGDACRVDPTNGGALTAAATEAVRTLLELQKAAAPPAVRLGATRSILEIGIKLARGGRPGRAAVRVGAAIGRRRACRP